MEFDDDLLVLGRVDNDDDENEPAVVLFVIEEVETRELKMKEDGTLIGVFSLELLSFPPIFHNFFRFG